MTSLKCSMRRLTRRPAWIVCLTLLSVLVAMPLGEQPRAGEPSVTRELRIPFDDLHVVLQSQPQRVMLSRSEYETLLAKAGRTPDGKSPQPAVVLSADYQFTVGDGRAKIEGVLIVEALDAGVHALPLDVGGVGLAAAQLDNRSAALGQVAGQPLTVFVEGRGRHRLKLELTAAVETTSARQTLQFRLPRPAATRMTLTAPGDVEIKSGADVISRTVDAAAQLTRFELVPPRAATSLVMTLNSHLMRQDRVVVARSVQVEEVTQAYERLHVTTTLEILHRPVSSFRWNVPDGFEVTEVTSPAVARWAVVAGEERRILEVQLREATSDPVTLSVTAFRAPARLNAWTCPQLVPRDVVGHVSVVGLLVEERLRTASLEAQGLLPIDTDKLRKAIPASVFRAEPGAPLLAAVAAYYAPHEAYRLTARFSRPPAKITLTSNTLLSLSEKGLGVSGGFIVVPQAERLFAFDFTAPAEWKITSVLGPDGRPLVFERYADGPRRTRMHTILPQGIAVAMPYRISYRGEYVPPQWLSEWSRQTVEFPQFTPPAAADVSGAVAVVADDDLIIRPLKVDHLRPLDEPDKEAYGLKGLVTNLAFHCQGADYQATLVVEHAASRLTARTFSCFRVEPEVLFAHYELLYAVENARTRKLSFLLPENTPHSLTVHGLGAVQVKESVSAPAENGLRRWTVLLADAQAGELRLGVDLQMPLGAARLKDLALPLVRAEGVVYQSGLAAVESAAEIEVTVTARGARKVDVGELADAEYQPGRRLLGAYGFVADGATLQTDLRASVVRHPPYALHAALVQRAVLETVLSAEGRSLTTARYALRTKDLLLEVRLPPGSTLWSVLIDDRPITPQTEGGKTLLGLPASDSTHRGLTLAYETPVASVPTGGRIELSAPELALRSGGAVAAASIPLADVLWRVEIPHGYQLLASSGTVVTQSSRPTPALWTALSACGNLSCGLAAVRKSAQPASERPLSDVMGALGDERLASTGTSFATQQSPPGKDSLAQPTAAPAAPEKPAKDAAPKAGRGFAYTVRGPVDLRGVRSLKIDTVQEPSVRGPVAEFASLGVTPKIDLIMAQQSRGSALSWALGLAIFVWGVRGAAGPFWTKVRYVTAVVLLGSILPLPLDNPLWVQLGNAAVLAGLALIPGYLAIWPLRVLSRFACWAMVPRPYARVAAALLVGLGGWSTTVAADELLPAGVYTMKIVDAAPPPVKIPADAVLIPYDPQTPPGGPERVLIPHDKYVELWNRAYPNKPLDSVRPPAEFALAGAAYQGVLAGEAYLLLSGSIEIDVFSDAYVSIPLGLSGGVLARAELDGKPARLNLAEPQAAKSAAERSLLVLYAQGRGRHLLTVEIRLRLERRGGWRVADGFLPAAPATALTLRVPQAQTEVRFAKITDRTNYETQAAGETIAITLGAQGTLGVQWRPKVAEGAVDSALTVRTSAVFDVQEDALRLTCQLQLEFRRAQRELFELELPSGYLVEKLAGQNVRGWELRDRTGRQSVEVRLLKTARDTECFSLALCRRGPVGQAALNAFDVPTVSVRGAALQTGELTVRRSPGLDVRTLAATGLTRIDVPQTAATIRLAEFQLNPLGFRPYQAYQFGTLPFALRLAATPTETAVSAQLRTVLRLSPYRRELECGLTLDIQGRPLYRIELWLPDDLDVQHLSAPGEFQWAITSVGQRRLLSVYLSQGQSGQARLVLRGPLGGSGGATEMKLPRLEVRGARRQDHQFAVQSEAAFQVEATELKDCTLVLLEQVFSWLTPQQRPVTRVALAAPSSDYAGTLHLRPRAPRVNCITINNVRVTPRAVEETVLLDYNVQDAGIHEVAFQLPPSKEEPRIAAPMLREKIVRRASDKPDAPWQVQLQFQDARMGQIRVLVQNDSVITGGPHRLTLPVVQTARVDRQFVTLESSGRDEVQVDRATGLERIDRQQSHWNVLRGYLGDKITLAYVAVPGAPQCELAFHSSDRQAVETARASIWLADTQLVLDQQGTYRAQVTYRMNNTTEQFLQVELPDGAELWTTHVAGDPVKPIQGTDDNPLHLRVPLVKTAQGDLDYPVVLKYAGKHAALGVWNEVDFPLVKTVNIKAARSLLTLHLPPQQRWFNFGDRMSRLSGADEAAGYRQAIDTEQARRLLETVRHGAAFDKARAFSSLSIVRDGIASRVESEAEIVNQAQEELALQQRQLPQTSELDNRAKLNSAYGTQVNGGVMVLQELDANFKPADLTRPARRSSEERFDDNWLAGNNLVTKPLAELKQPQQGPAVSRVQQRKGKEAAKTNSADKSIQWDVSNVRVNSTPAVAYAGGPVQVTPQSQTTAGGVSLNLSSQAQSAPARNGYGEDAVIARYKQKLETHNSYAGASAATAERMPREESEMGGAYRGDAHRFQTEAGARRELGAATELQTDSLALLRGGLLSDRNTAAAAPAAVKPTGLASLDVEIPLRGQTFYFTAPHGDVHMNAWCVSQDMLGRTARSICGLVGLGLLVGMFRFTRKRLSAV